MYNESLQHSTLRIPGYPHPQDTQLIAWLEGSGNYTIIYLMDALKPLMASRTLKYFERHLPGFVRVSKSSVVNPAYVRRVTKVDSKTMYLELINGMTIGVPRRRIGETLARLDATLSLIVQR